MGPVVVGCLVGLGARSVTAFEVAARSVTAFEVAESFLLVLDPFGEGFESCAEVGDLGGEAGDGVVGFPRGGDAPRPPPPRGTGFGASGSRIDRNENNPDTAANRRFTVAADNMSVRRPSSPTTFAPPGRPATRSLRQAAKNRNNTSVVTSPRSNSSSANQRQNANSPNP